MPRAVIIYGPPGAGKGTQANLLAWKKGWIHFDTGKFLETLAYDPANARKKTIARERRNFESGRLFTPSFVLREVARRAQQIAEAGASLVFSGSPRTLYEAFGTKKQVGLVATLEKLYGKKNVRVVVLAVTPASSLRRNANRLICSFCGTPSLMLYADKKCPPRVCLICGAPLRRRTLDKPVIIKERLREFKNRTEPIFSELRRRGYRLHEIDGEPAPYTVAHAIAKKIA